VRHETEKTCAIMAAPIRLRLPHDSITLSCASGAR